MDVSFLYRLPDFIEAIILTCYNELTVEQG